MFVPEMPLKNLVSVALSARDHELKEPIKWLSLATNILANRSLFEEFAGESSPKNFSKNLYQNDTKTTSENSNITQSYLSILTNILSFKVRLFVYFGFLIAGITIYSKSYANRCTKKMYIMRPFSSVNRTRSI